MKSVLITTDYVRRNNGELTPVEINTNSGYNFKLPFPLTIENFESNFDQFFDYIAFNSFLSENHITKIITIEQLDRYSRIFKLFCEKFNYEFTQMIIGNDTLVPDIEEDDNELVIRIAYDTFAVLDDLYTRDMYEFHNLIKDEDFSSTVTFDSSLELNTITIVEPSIGEDWPNYILKSRLPGYSIKDYPVLYNIQTQSQLEGIQNNLKENEFLQKYEIHSGSLEEHDGRHRSYRSTDLIYGSELDTLQLFSYQSILDVSIDNEKFIYDSPYEEDGITLNELHSSRFLPISKILVTYPFHFDETDFILGVNNELLSSTILKVEDELKTIKFIDVIESGSLGYPLDENDLQNFDIVSSSIAGFTVNDSQTSAFINIKVTHTDYGEFEWYDGITTPYYIQKNGYPEYMFFYDNIGFIEPTDKILIFNNELQKTIPFDVIDVTFDIKKGISTKLMSLTPYPKFFVEITNEEFTHSNSPLFLIQHNNCSAGQCLFASHCPSQCSTCSKNDSGCPDCGGFGTGMQCGFF